MTVRPRVPALSTDDVIEMLSRNTYLLGRQIEGLSQEDTLLQPQPRGNCMNWVVGHIARNRQHIIDILGATPEPTDLSRYDRGSKPVTGLAEDVTETGHLMTILKSQLQIIKARLDELTADQLAAPSPADAQRSVVGNAHFMAWHETVHIGETTLLRQLAGTDDQVIA